MRFQTICAAMAAAGLMASGLQVSGGALRATEDPAPGQTPGQTLGQAPSQAAREESAPQAALVQPQAKPRFMQFRDIFADKGKPSDLARETSGKQVTMVGFVAPPPDKSSPFLVLVGEPTTFCPYCSTISEHDHLPFVLVYTGEPVDHEHYGLRRRLRVTGRLNADHGNEPTYGFHRDVEILDAVIEDDFKNRRLTPAQIRAKAAEKKAAAEGGIDPAEIDG